MKGILKKNQVIITALVIMIAVAGYLNFTQDKINDTALTGKDSVETNADGTTQKDSSDETKSPDNTSSKEEKKEDSEKKEAKEDMDEMNLGTVTYDADGNEVISVGQEGEDLTDLSAEDLGEDDLAKEEIDKNQVADQGDGDTVGEAVLVSNNIGADYFASAKLEREQNRAKNKETLMEIVDNTAISEEQKKEAINNVIAMTAIAEKESAAEMLLEAKGFTEVVVRMAEDNVDVIVNADNLTQQQMAQIEDIVKRKTGVAAENIVITPVSVEK